jgi:hypothetical protein
VSKSWGEAVWTGGHPVYEVTPFGEWLLHTDGTRELLDGTVLPALPPEPRTGNEYVCTKIDYERGVITFTSKT